MDLRMLEKILEIFLPIYIVIGVVVGAADYAIIIASTACLIVFIVIDIYKRKYKDGMLIVDTAQTKDTRYKLIFNTDMEHLESKKTFNITVVHTDSSKIIDSQE